MVANNSVPPVLYVLRPDFNLTAPLNFLKAVDLVAIEPRLLQSFGPEACCFALPDGLPVYLVNAGIRGVVLSVISHVRDSKIESFGAPHLRGNYVVVISERFPRVHLVVWGFARSSIYIPEGTPIHPKDVLGLVGGAGIPYLVVHAYDFDDGNKPIPLEFVEDGDPRLV